MKVAIGSDHKGFKLKVALVDYLKVKGYSVSDFGTFSDLSCDYPLYCRKVAQALVAKKVQKGVFICMTGIGSSVALNKVKGIRAALVHNLRSARFARLHNDSNVLVLGSAFVKINYAKKILGVWLSTKFEGGRHQRRVSQIGKIEEKNGL